MTGKLYRSTGAAFVEVNGFTLSPIKDVHVTPSGKVFVVSSNNTSMVCASGDCSMATSYTMLMTDSSNDTFDGLCGNGERVFAITNGSANQAQLYEYVGNAWMKASNDLGFTLPRRCVAGPSGEVYVLGRTFVVRFQNAGFGQENVDLMGQTAADWNDMAFTFSGTQVRSGMLVGGSSLAAGSLAYRYARRRAAGGGWDSLPFQMNVGDRLNAVIATGPDEFLAAGFTGGVSTVPRFLEWRGTQWAAVPMANQPPSVLASVIDGAAASDREVFLVGTATSGGYAIIRGQR